MSISDLYFSISAIMAGAIGVILFGYGVGKALGIF